MRYYVVQKGDTLESIAQKTLLQSIRASEIKNLNGIIDPIREGQVLKIPDIVKTQQKAKESKGLSVFINNKKLDTIPEITIKNAVDTIATVFSFSLPTQSELAQNIKPFDFSEIKILFKDKVLLNGYIVAETVKDEAGTTSSFTGYSKTGILQSVNLPLTMYPRTFYKKSLFEIAEKICKPFDIFVNIEDDAETQSIAKKKIVKATINPTQSIANFLNGLAEKKGLFLTSSTDGDLIFKRTKSDNQPTLKLVNPKGQINFNAENLFSDYSGIQSGNTQAKPKQGNIKLDIGIFKNKVFERNDSNETLDLKEFLKNKKRQSLLNAISLNIVLPYITDKNGKIFEPSDIVTVKSNYLKINEDTDFIILESTLKFKNGGNFALLNLVPFWK